MAVTYSDDEYVATGSQKIAVRKESGTNRLYEKITLYDGSGNPIGAEELGPGYGLYVINLAKQESQGVFAVGDDVTAGLPVYLGAYATTSLSNPTPQTDGKMQALRSTTDGRLLSLPYHNPEDSVFGTAADATGALTTFLAAGTSGFRNYITWMHVNNLHATTAVGVEIRDGDTTLVDYVWMPANTTLQFTYPTPLRGTAATNWRFITSAAVTTIRVTAGGYKSKV